ncbi:hypothetical protein RRG08_018990 [Elysia crispata]|uniref:Uncharacterized protein n=1 Tax=Elysia crispata TaxID=231223 RepID=A0AAE1DSK6_9GAST|nr:hypothetical protein RRG08_018990 [Elysia crispata]
MKRGNRVVASTENRGCVDLDVADSKRALKSRSRHKRKTTRSERAAGALSQAVAVSGVSSQSGLCQLTLSHRSGHDCLHQHLACLP